MLLQSGYIICFLIRLKDVLKIPDMGKWLTKELIEEMNKFINLN